MYEVMQDINLSIHLCNNLYPILSQSINQWNAQSMLLKRETQRTYRQNKSEPPMIVLHLAAPSTERMPLVTHFPSREEEIHEIGPLVTAQRPTHTPPPTCQQSCYARRRPFCWRLLCHCSSDLLRLHVWHASQEATIVTYTGSR